MSKQNTKRSPLFYVGDKHKIIGQIRKKFPRNINRFFEPFLGGGTVFLNVDAKEYFLNDIDENIVNIHKYLHKRSKNVDLFLQDVSKAIDKFSLSKSYREDIVPTKLKDKWNKTYYAKFNKEGYIKMRDSFNKAPKKNPLVLYLLLIYGFNRMLRFNKKGWFNLPVGNVDFNINTEKALRSYFRTVANRKINFYNVDFLDFLEKQAFLKNDFVYLDPPYLIAHSEYNKLWSNNQEAKLLHILNKLNKRNVKFALSNVSHYRNRKNKKLLNWMTDYNVREIKSNYISYHNNFSKKIREVLVTNYD